MRRVGSNVDSVRVGDRVIAITGFGGFSTHVVVPETSVARMPHEMDFRQAAALVTTYVTSAWSETLLVLGASGGIGTAAIELGRVLGARVIAAGSRPSLGPSRSLGADAVIDYEAEDLKSRVRELTDGRGADVVIDPVGGIFTEPAVRSMAWGGRHLMVGFAAGPIPQLPLNLLLLKSVSRGPSFQ